MFRLWIVAAGVLALGAVRLVVRMRRAHDTSVKMDSLSTEWLAHERGRHEHTP